MVLGAWSFGQGLGVGRRNKGDRKTDLDSKHQRCGILVEMESGP